MTQKEKLGRLEELLARVQRRATEQRPMPVSHVSPKATTGAMASVPTNGPLPTAHATRPSLPQASPPANAFPSSPPEATPPSEPPIEAGPSTIPPLTTVDAGADSVDVEVSTEMVDIDVDVDMDIDDMGMPLESGAQPVADHAAFGDDQGMGDTTMADAHLPVLGPENEVHSEQQHGAQTLANEIEEPAPSSSPRRVGSETPEAFEEESAPRHTPPPESGKQVAAAPSAPPARKTSAPPPSLEGHTLIGGWREPGLGGPIIGAPGGQGVRVPAPPQAPPPAPAAAAPPEPVTGTRPAAPSRHDRPLSPEVTRAELGSVGAKVASFQGTAPAFKPSTFGDLLDASLGL
jgi:hypothetical protein